MRRLNIRRKFLVIVAMLLNITSVAQTVSVVPEVVKHYEREINSAISSSNPISLEKVFEEGIAAAEALGGSELDRLDDSTFQKVKRMMIGFWVNRVEVVVVAPDPSFFLNLAREKGTKVDRAFFDALKKTYPHPKSWSPAYERPQTDFSGCIIFDGETLSNVYEAWKTFQDIYPERYNAGLRREFARIAAALESTCVCGGEDEYRSELQKFLKSYPTSPFAPKVSSRLEAAKSNTSKIRFHCLPH